MPVIPCTLLALLIGALGRCWADIKRRRNDMRRASTDALAVSRRD